MPNQITVFKKGKWGKDDSWLMGGKGANLAELQKLDGFEVPPFVNLTTQAFHEFLAADDKSEFIKTLTLNTLAEFNSAGMFIGGDILVSVRSGAPVSMPGMMDTILNVGLSLETQEAWEAKFGAHWFWDSYSRLLIQLCEAFGLSDVPKHDAYKGFRNAQIVTGILKRGDIDVDQFTSPAVSLSIAIRAVFDSWMTDRAIYYRKINGISDDLGTACNVQRMVFGNLNDTSGTGVLFTRDPSSGDNAVTGEFLVQAQGEDVVDGSTTPLPLKELEASTIPDHISDQLLELSDQLETHYKDMQDVEFTIEDGKLWILQTRTAKRTSEAAFRIALEMIDEDIITTSEAIERINVDDWYNSRKVEFLNTVEADFKGQAAGSGIAFGRAVFTSKEAEEATDPVILVRPETTPDDIAGMFKSQGVITYEGGMTSHAAVVARGMNIPCIVGVGGTGILGEGDLVAMDSSTGEIWVNREMEISDQGGSIYADKLIALIQSEKNIFARRNKYAPFTLLSVASMTDQDFLEMISQVEKSGAWYEGIILDTSEVLPFRDTGDGLVRLAKLTVLSAIAKKMGHRQKAIEKIFHTGKVTHTVGTCQTVQKISELKWSGQGHMYKINVKDWKNFLGPLYDNVVQMLIDNPPVDQIIDLIPNEAGLIENIFGRT